MNGEGSVNTTNSIFHDQYYEKYIKQYLDDDLKQFILIMKKDRMYNLDRQLQPWEYIVPKLCIVLRRIINEHFKADEKSFDFFGKIETDPKLMISIKDLINKIENRLINDFIKSPPFTIYQFISTMFFLCDEDIENCVDKNLIDRNIIIKYNGLKKYIKKENDLLTQEISESEIFNVYHEEDEEIIREISKNDVYAIKYLRSLIKIISIESSIEEVNKDMENYGSKNKIFVKSDNVINDNDKARIGEDKNENEFKNIETNLDTSINSIKMVRIPWYDSQIHSLSTFHDTPPNEDNDSDSDECDHSNTIMEPLEKET